MYVHALCVVCVSVYCQPPAITVGRNEVMWSIVEIRSCDLSQKSCDRS